MLVTFYYVSLFFNTHMQICGRHISPKRHTKAPALCYSLLDGAGGAGILRGITDWQRPLREKRA